VVYCGLDVAMKSSYLHVSDERGKRLVSGPVATEKQALKQRLGRFVRHGLQVAIEAGNQTAWLHEALIEMGAEVTVVNPTRVKLIAESRRKTDKIDAKLLCDLLRLDGLPCPVHMPCRRTRELRGLLAARRKLVSARTKLCNVVRGVLRQEGMRLPVRALSTRTGWDRLMVRRYRHDHLQPILRSYYLSFQALTESLKDLDAELARYEREDPRAARLETMPGVGRIAALTFLAAVDEIGRFSSSRKLVSYSGLCPRVRSSGERTEYGPISRQGRSELRAVWVQIAHRVVHDERLDAGPLRDWFWAVAGRRGKKTATVALTRKLLTIAYHLLNYQQEYDPSCLRKAA
jgi:transposase